jgi:hypothetical protein
MTSFLYSGQKVEAALRASRPPKSAALSPIEDFDGASPEELWGHAGRNASLVIAAENVFVIQDGRIMASEDDEELQETVKNMVEHGIYHLPFPATYIEADAPSFLAKYRGPWERIAIMAWEADDDVDFAFAWRNGSKWHACPRYNRQRPSAFGSDGDDVYSRMPSFELANFYSHVTSELEYTLMADIEFQLVRAVSTMISRTIIALHTRGIQVERVGGASDAENARRASKGKVPLKARYLIRVSPHVVRQEVADEGGSRKSPRIHWRRGYVWGKHTRPVEEQRWIAPTLVGATDNMPIPMEDVLRAPYAI